MQANRRVRSAEAGTKIRMRVCARLMFCSASACAWPTSLSAFSTMAEVRASSGRTFVLQAKLHSVPITRFGKGRQSPRAATARRSQWFPTSESKFVSTCDSRGQTGSANFLIRCVSSRRASRRGSVSLKSRPRVLCAGECVELFIKRQ